jgi:hypothetical protein
MYQGSIQVQSLGQEDNLVTSQQKSAHLLQELLQIHLSQESLFLWLAKTFFPPQL